MTDNDKKKRISQISMELWGTGFATAGKCEKAAEKLVDKGFRKQIEGEWIQQMRPYEDEIECSVCNEWFNILDNCTEKFDFCPNCGAKMKGGESGS